MSRIAVPIIGSVDAVRAFVDALHVEMEVEHCFDDCFFALSARCKLKGRLASNLSHLKGKEILVLIASKIRGTFYRAMEELAKHGDESISRLAKATREIEHDQALASHVDLLSEQVRGVKFCFFGTEGVSVNEVKAWTAAGATAPPPQGDFIRARIIEIEETIKAMTEKYGGEDSLKWAFGEGKALADVFSADDKKKEFEALRAKVAELKKRLGE